MNKYGKIILFGEDYEEEAKNIFKDIRKHCHEEIMLQKIEDNFIPYASGRELVYGEDKKKEFNTIVLIYPLTYKNDEDIFYKLQSIENMDCTIRLYCMPDKRLMSNKVYPMINAMYKKAYEGSVLSMKKNAEEYEKLLKKHRIFRYIDGAGSDFIFERDSDIVRDLFTNEEKGIIQLPSGEVFFSVKENSAQGCIYIENRKYEIHNNKIIYHYSDKEEIVMCEFGLGINDNLPVVTRLDISEKIFKTCHFGFGSNVSFGGTIEEGYHFDIVFKDFALYGDEELIIEWKERK